MEKCYACGCGRVLLLYRVPTPTRYGIFHFSFLWWLEVATVGKNFFENLPQVGMTATLVGRDKEKAEG